MNKILEKVLAELQKPEPDVSYIRGMVETLIEMQGGVKEVPVVATGAAGPGGGTILDLMGGARIEEAKRLSEASK